MESYVLYVGLAFLLSIIILRFMVLQHVSIVHSYLLLTSTPSYGYTTMYLFIYHWMDLWAIASPPGGHRGEVPSGLDE